jgi:citrate synthase
MAKVNSILTERLKMATKKLTKMTNLAELSSSGNLSSFSGIFRVTALSVKEQEALQTILTTFAGEKKDVDKDFQSLSAITSEVKAINNQAAILHGERIKKAQEILKKYRDGAFSAWLMTVYGNRQTPYNFLQYFELHSALPEKLHPKLDEMPRQAVYTLASRAGSLEKKEEIIKNYQGEAKSDLLLLIRNTFPLALDDKRKQDVAEYAIQVLTRLQKQLSESPFVPNEAQKKTFHQLLKSLKSLTDQV